MVWRGIWRKGCSLVYINDAGTWCLKPLLTHRVGLETGQRGYRIVIDEQQNLNVSVEMIRHTMNALLPSPVTNVISFGVCLRHLDHSCLKAQ